MVALILKIVLVTVTLLVASPSWAQDSSIDDLRASLDRADALIGKLNERNVAVWGDSLALGSGARTGRRFWEVAEDMFGDREVVSFGVGGQNSSSVIARMGAIPIVLTLKGDKIPRGGSVQVLSSSRQAITTGGPDELHGTLCGVVGRLWTSDRSADPISLKFSPTFFLDEVSCPPESEFVVKVPPEISSRVAWLWLGRNGADKDSSFDKDIARAVKTLGHDRFLVISMLISEGDTEEGRAAFVARNKLLADTYGEKFVDIRTLLLASAKTPDDKADAEKLNTPGSLRADGIHLNEAGQQIIARALVDATNRLYP